MWVPHVIEGLAGMQVRIANFFAREQLSAGFRFAHVPMTLVSASIGFPARGFAGIWLPLPSLNAQLTFWRLQGAGAGR
jgi:hypothetical protein